MEVIRVRNVEQALHRGCDYLISKGYRSPSRAGEVIVAPGPVTTTYMRPWERVIFNERRDANPFFHLIESLWMLGGFNNARILDRYVRDFSSRFAEEDGVCHGAYGYRWRQHFTHFLSGVSVDQIKAVGDMLFNDITTRRAVLAMWDPMADLGAQKKDLPCNTHIYFSGRDINGTRVLDMTVCNRSNDIIWGAYGANAVHMSILHELICGLANAEMGVYHQMSNNYHMYADTMHLQPMSLSDDGCTYTYDVTSLCGKDHRRKDATAILYHATGVIGQINRGAAADISTGIHWIDTVIKPMAVAHELYKEKQYLEAQKYLGEACSSMDWACAGIQWIARRQKKIEEKKNGTSNS